MRVRISSYKKLDSQDYLIEVSLDNTSLSYGMVSGKKYVALGKNVSRLRKLFESPDSGIVMVRKYAYRVIE
jgi:hypothetical protein